MSSIAIQNAPARLTMQDFRSYSDMYNGLAKSHRFAVRINPTGEYVSQYASFTQQLTYMCEVSELPGKGFMSVDYRYYGPNFKLPFQTQYEDVNMTFLCRTGSFEREFFDNWMTIINPLNTWDFNYRDQYASEIDIYQFSEIAGEDGNHVAEYNITLHNAYPILMNPQPVTWQDDNFQRLIVNFTFTKWSRKGIDPVPRSSGPNETSFSLVEGRQVTRD